MQDDIDVELLRAAQQEGYLVAAAIEHVTPAQAAATLRMLANQLRVAANWIENRQEDARQRARAVSEEP